MCIILACEGNARPTSDMLTTCWHHNPDGAGVMWAEGGRVEIVKGLMTLRDLQTAVGLVPDGSPMVVHLRIGTSGGLGAEVTHPYPVSSDLAQLHALDVECPVGIAHNGVLPYPTDDKAGVSDTVYYVSHVVAPLARRRGVCRAGGLCHSRKARRTLAETSKGSRLALLQGDGSMMLVGTGWQGAGRGIQASNGSWRDDYGSIRYGFGRYPYYYYPDDDWDDYGDDDPRDARMIEAMEVFGCTACDGYDECRKNHPWCFDEPSEVLDAAYTLV